MDRRDFLKVLSAAGVASTFGSAEELLAAQTHPSGSDRPGRIVNEYIAYLPGEREALAEPPTVKAIDGRGATAGHGHVERKLAHGEDIAGWVLITTVEINGVMTAVLEKHATHRGAIAYVTERGGTIALIPKQVGDLSRVRPRPTNTPHGVKLERPLQISPGPDVTGEYILKSVEDPCYENVAALGAEYIGWSLVANEEAGPLGSIYLEADGTSRQPKKNPQTEWAPDLEGRLFDPSRYFPFAAPERYAYQHGYSKRTLLGGYLPVADTAVWNAEYGCGYELMMLLPPGVDAQPIGRMRMMIPDEDVAHYEERDTLVVHAPDGRAY
ncbi:MAG TPA: twin-arginine translocation signal domain-containing protein, partial [Acidobacteriaceae bacterium]